jgi:hypothetical protein
VEISSDFPQGSDKRAPTSLRGAALLGIAKLTLTDRQLARSDRTRMLEVK